MRLPFHSLQRRRGTVAGLALALLLIAVPADAAQKHGAESKPQSLDEANQALVGRAATIDLFEGTTIRQATSVRVEPDLTHWVTDAGTEQVQTSEVRRVAIQPRYRILKSAALGLGAGTLVGLVAVGSNEDTGTFLDPAADAAALGASMIGGTAIGAVVGATAGKRRGRVVYETPVDRYLTDSGPAPESVTN